MYRLFARFVLVVGCTMALPVDRAGADPVVVELFTSQGCSSCPPADALLSQLAKDDGVIALALHVDYWDYLGWEDAFALPSHTERQRAYARAAGERMIYTPQMIIAGKDHVVGYRPKEVARLIAFHAAMPDAVEVKVMPRENGRVAIAADGPAQGDLVVQVVGYEPRGTVRIERGENAGRRIDYVNIVTGIEVVAQWDGTAPLMLEVTPPAATHSVVLVQKAMGGPIVAAARLR